MTTQKSWSNQKQYSITFTIVFIVLFLVFWFLYIGFNRLHSMASKPEYLTPDYLVGERIPGTNYTVDGKDTLLIKKNVRVSYTYQILTKHEKIELRKQLSK